MLNENKMKYMITHRKKEEKLYSSWEWFALIIIFIGVFASNTLVSDLLFIVLFIFYCLRYYAGKYEINVEK